MSELLTLLKNAVGQGVLRAVDYQFARMLQRHGASERATLAAALTSAELAQGHVCLRIAQPEYEGDIAQAVQQLSLHALEPEAGIVGDGSELTPLVLESGRLYLYRYWQYEQQVATQILQRCSDLALDRDTLAQALDRLFAAGSEPDWQRLAAALAAQRRFAVISGGPGTGKTTTVTKLLALVVEQFKQRGQRPVIRLAAPTGKAAARLSESIAGALAALALPESVEALIPDQASTLHRLLGVIPNSHSFRHNRDNPLHLDLLVVDEASMIDLPMMARLLDALPPDAQLILLGDRDQLASVEAGSVLGDICRWPGEVGYSEAMSAQLSMLCGIRVHELQQRYSTPLADSVALLRKSYRFHDQSGIGHLARAVNSGDRKRFVQVCEQGYDDIDCRYLTAEVYQQMISQVVEGYANYLELIAAGASPQAVLSSFNQFQLLCALREGLYGVSGLNERIRHELAQRGWLKSEGAWYSGRPVMITRNDASLELYNGDVGIALPDEEGRLRVWFEQGGRMRAILPSLLPEHETVFAMTVHKSQGSEFAQVYLLLPAESNAVVTRELLYTGITRAKTSLVLAGSQRVFDYAMAQATERRGGLAEKLWQGP
jgi:exodeoxyribonuclease V alpha subunit